MLLLDFVLLLILSIRLCALRIHAIKEKPEAKLKRGVRQVSSPRLWVQQVYWRIEREKKNRRQNTWDSAKAKMNLDQICCEMMCIFKRNVIRVSDSFTMTLSKCHVMKVIQGPIILLSFQIAFQNIFF